MAMRSFWTEPYLWIHLAGIAALPLLLELCLLGLAVGDPLLPVWLELALIAGVGIAPVLWMQWSRPFYIFSIVVLSLKPEQLTEKQRRILRLFKASENQVVAVLTPIFLLGVLWQLYQIAPVAASVVPFPPQWRLLGLLLAAIAFLGCNLFLQVPVSVVRVLLTHETEFARLEPYPLESIRRSFTIPGVKVNQILPPLEETPISPTE
jgi:hypothetical protein